MVSHMLWRVLQACTPPIRGGVQLSVNWGTQHQQSIQAAMMPQAHKQCTHLTSNARQHTANQNAVLYCAMPCHATLFLLCCAMAVAVPCYAMSDTYPR